MSALIYHVSLSSQQRPKTFPYALIFLDNDGFLSISKKVERKIMA
jgi:hypothetical protein